MYDEKIEKNGPLHRGGTSSIYNDVYLPKTDYTERDMFIQRFIERVDINNLKKHLKRIVKVRNPEVAIENLDETASYITSVLNNYRLYTGKEKFSFKKVKDVKFSNIIGYKTGLEKNKFLILCSHYDTVKTSPGADDNASSVSSLLEIARLMSVLNLEYTVQFTFFTLEEYNMLGSIYHVKNLIKKANRNIIGSIVLDSIGYTNNKQKQFDNISYPQSSIGDFLSIISNKNSSSLLKLFSHNVSKYTPELKIEPLIINGNGELVPDTRRSDHSSFWDKDYKSILLTDTAQFRNENNHKMTDTMDTLDYNLLLNTTKATLATTLDICLKR